MNNFLDFILDGRYRKFSLSNGKQYVFDKLIFISIVFLLLITAVIIINYYNFDKSQHVYYKCDTNQAYCYNEYYNNKDICGIYLPAESYLCTTELITPPYEYGIPQPFIVKHFDTIAYSILLLGLLLNHFLYNRKVFEKIGEFND